MAGVPLRRQAHGIGITLRHTRRLLLRLRRLKNLNPRRRGEFKGRIRNVFVDRDIGKNQNGLRAEFIFKAGAQDVKFFRIHPER